MIVTVNICTDRKVNLISISIKCIYLLLFMTSFLVYQGGEQMSLHQPSVKEQFCGRTFEK